MSQEGTPTVRRQPDRAEVGNSRTSRRLSNDPIRASESSGPKPNASNRNGAGFESADDHEDQNGVTAANTEERADPSGWQQQGIRQVRSLRTAPISRDAQTRSGFVGRVRRRRSTPWSANRSPSTVQHHRPDHARTDTHRTHPTTILPVLRPNWFIIVEHRQPQVVAASASDDAPSGRDTDARQDTASSGTRGLTAIVAASATIGRAPRHGDCSGPTGGAAKSRRQRCCGEQPRHGQLSMRHAAYRARRDRR